MTNKIQRWSFWMEDVWGKEVEPFGETVPHGEYVKYKDHERIVAELQKKIGQQNAEITDRAWQNLCLLHRD